MTDIYDLHDKAFARVSAYVILRSGEKVATVAIKHPADGAGRLYAYVHWLGVPMVRGFAGGYGYDKRSAACADAAKRLPDPAETMARAAGWKTADLTPGMVVCHVEHLRDEAGRHPTADSWLAALAIYSGHQEPAKRDDWIRFRVALSMDGGDDWTRALERAGFTVLQAV